MRRAVWLGLLLLQVLVVCGFWFGSHWHHPLGNQLLGSATGQLLAWGRLAGLLAAFGCLLQVVLISRARWVEPLFGLDRLTRVHHATGFLLVVLLLAHPLLVTLGHARQADLTAWEQVIDFTRTWHWLLAAQAGGVLLLAAVGMSVAIVRLRLRYEAWHATHLTIYLALALALGHQLSAGGDLAGHAIFRAWWVALYGFVFLSLLGYRLVRPWWNLRRHGFVVGQLVAETANVTSVHIHGRDLGRFRAQAGQFVLVRFLAPGFWQEAHPFSLSRPPDGRELRLTIKQLGDFTCRIPALPAGTRVLIDGPHGIFTAERARASKILMVAGGIGITPVRAVAEVLLASGHEVVLLYGNRDRASAALYDELECLAATAGGRLRVVHVMSADPGWAGEQGRVDGGCLARNVPDLLERDCYLCGPPSLQRLVRAALLAAGVPANRIFDERFAL